MDTHKDTAPVSLKPAPKQLVIDNGDDMAIRWKQWLRHYTWYAVATILNSRGKENPIATFMTIIGEKA